VLFLLRMKREHWDGLHSTVQCCFYCTVALKLNVYIDIIKLVFMIMCDIDCNYRQWSLWDNDDCILSHTLPNLNISLVRSWENSSFLTLNHLARFFPLLTISLSLAILTCLLNRRLKPLSKALALGTVAVTFSHLHSIIACVFCVIFLSASLFPQPRFSVSWPLWKSKQLFSSCSLFLALSLCRDCVLYSSIEGLYII